MPDKEKKYIKRLKEKLATIDDIELSILVNKLINEREELLKSVKLDSLTGVYNRNVLNEIDDFNVVVILDIDNFKAINDTYGHDSGDVALKTISKVLLTNTRINDYVCRYGGDEFLIIFNGCDLDVVCHRLEKIKMELAKPIRNEDFSITLSDGIAVREDDESLEDTITNADIALYMSKMNGKNQFSVYRKDKTLSLKL